MNTNLQPTISDLFPGLELEQAGRADQNIEAYLALVVRVYSRIKQDPKALAALRRALRGDVDEPL